jgi:hypothetical protein
MSDLRDRLLAAITNAKCLQTEQSGCNGVTGLNPLDNPCVTRALSVTPAFANNINAVTPLQVDSANPTDRLTAEPYGRVLATLCERCPEHVELSDWQCAIEDSRRFLAQWGNQAEALGWTARDLFGLAAIPNEPVANYRRLSRYDQTGLIWLLRGRAVTALTKSTAFDRESNRDGSRLPHMPRLIFNQRKSKDALAPVL